MDTTSSSSSTSTSSSSSSQSAVSYSDFVKLHDSQLRSLASQQQFPESLWPRLHHKLINDLLDAGDSLMFVRIQYNDEDKDEVEDEDIDENEREPSAPKDEECPRYGVVATHDVATGCDVWVIDHCLTFTTLAQAREALVSYPPLCERLETMVREAGGGIPAANRPQDRVQAIVERLFQVTFVFAYLQGERQMRQYYVLDELGMRVSSSDGTSADQLEPNVRIAPFHFVPTNTTFSVLWPIKDVSSEELLVRTPLQMMPQYDSQAYWQLRYATTPAASPGEGTSTDGEHPWSTYEWYCSYDALKPTLEDVLTRKEGRVLIAGCGNSALGVDLTRDGYSAVVNVDYSAAAVALMAAQYPSETWLVADLTDATACEAVGLHAGSFAAIIDKGTLDAIMNVGGENGPSNNTMALAYLMQMCALLEPVPSDNSSSHGGGVLVLLSLAPPPRRLPLLLQVQTPGLRWAVRVVEHGRARTMTSEVHTNAPVEVFVYVCQRALQK